MVQEAIDVVNDDKPIIPKVIVQDDSGRHYLFGVYLCFTLLMIPVWWFTTSVSRVSLNIPNVSEATPALFSIIYVSIIGGLHQKERWELVNGIQFTAIPHEPIPRIFRIRLVDFIEPDPAIVSNEEILHTLADKSESIGKSSFQFYILDTTLAANSVQEDVIVHPEKRAILATFKGNASMEQYIKEIVAKILLDSYVIQETNIADAPSYQINLNLVAGYSPDDKSSSIRPLDWEINEAVKSWFMPIVEELQSIADFKVNIQIRPFAEFTIPATFRDDRYYIIPSDATRLVDENQLRLSKSINEDVVINFVLYLPPPSIRPLFLEGSIDKLDEVVMQISSWGAIYLFNEEIINEIIAIKALKRPLGIFAAQLKEMFIGHRNKSKVVNSTIIHPLELDELMVHLVQRRKQSACDTLQALRRLLDQNREIVVEPIIKNLVDQALASIHRTHEALKEGDLEKALHKASRALQFTDAAFFHPTMMAHQYFPQEHKLGVYLPLILPLVLPILLALVMRMANMIKYNLLRLIRKEKRQ